MKSSAYLPASNTSLHPQPVVVMSPQPKVHGDVSVNGWTPETGAYSFTRKPNGKIVKSKGIIPSRYLTAQSGQ